VTDSLCDIQCKLLHVVGAAATQPAHQGLRSSDAVDRSTTKPGISVTILIGPPRLFLRLPIGYVCAPDGEIESTVMW